MLCTSDADCSGFNLKTQLCEMYSYEPSRFVRVPDCEYRQVSSKSQSGKSVPDKWRPVAFCRDKNSNSNTVNQKKQALKRVQRPTPALFLCLVTLNFVLLTPKLEDFQDSWWNTSTTYTFGDPITASFSSTHADRQGVDISVTVCVFVFVCICAVTDFSAEDKASGFKFCSAVPWRSRQEITNFCELCSPRSPHLDESASARVRRPKDSRFERCAQRVDIGSACVDICQSYWRTPFCLSVNLILAPVPPFPTHLFLHPSLLPFLIHQFVYL